MSDIPFSNASALVVIDSTNLSIHLMIIAVPPRAPIPPLLTRPERAQPVPYTRSKWVIGTKTRRSGYTSRLKPLMRLYLDDAGA